MTLRKLKEQVKGMIGLSDDVDEFTLRNEIVEECVRLRRKLHGMGQRSSARCASFAELAANDYNWQACLVQLEYVTQSWRS